MLPLKGLWFLGLWTDDDDWVGSSYNITGYIGICLSFFISFLWHSAAAARRINGKHVSREWPYAVRSLMLADKEKEGRGVPIRKT